MQEKLNKLTLFLAIYGVNKSCGLRTNITSLYTSNPYYSNPQGYSYTWTRSELTRIMYLYMYLILFIMVAVTLSLVNARKTE